MLPLLLLSLLLCAAPARAENAESQARDAAVVPLSGDDASVRESAARPFDGSPESETVVAGRDRTGAAVLARSSPVERASKKEPPLAGEQGARSSKLSTGLMMGGAALLGGMQGWFSAGLLGAAAGAGLGLAAAWLFHKKDYGGAFGVTAGAIIGTALGGPIGGLIGAVVGGVIGHFLGKLFL
ncbi:MAG: hypothetical protein Q8T11_10165 [Elusimicrobiota bacterium]|nr:hypothetical protein [Elusimicrobiota bacterium]